MSYYQKSLDLTKARDKTEVRQAVILANMAGIAGDQKNWSEAIGLFKTALKLQADANNLSSPDALISRTTLANMQRQSGDVTSAAETINATLTSVESALPEDHFITAYVQNVAAVTFCDTSQWQAGLDYAKRSLATREKIMPPEHWVLASGKSVLGHCEARAGNYDKARALLTEALEKLTELRGADGTQTLQTVKRLESLDAAENGAKKSNGVFQSPNV
jgi:tetratricopeptide (TPR) repeat protein